MFVDTEQGLFLYNFQNTIESGFNVSCNLKSHKIENYSVINMTGTKKIYNQK